MFNTSVKTTMISDGSYAVWLLASIVTLVQVPMVLGNGLIIMSIIKNRKLRSNMHVLIGNLAVSDIIVGAILIPFDIIIYFYQIKTKKYVCLALLAGYVLSLGSSCYNLLWISIERYIVIMHPLRNKITKSKMIVMIAFGWIGCALSAGLPLFGVNSFINANSECLAEKVWNKVYYDSCDWLIIIALLVNIICYVIVVVIAVRKSRQESAIGVGHRQARKNLYQLITMVIVLGTFILCWLPHSVMSVVVTFWDTPYYHYIKRCTLIPGVFNSSVNWIIYGYRSLEFRRSFAALIRCRCSFGNRGAPSTLDANNTFPT